MLFAAWYSGSFESSRICTLSVHLAKKYTTKLDINPFATDQFWYITDFLHRFLLAVQAPVFFSRKIDLNLSLQLKTLPTAPLAFFFFGFAHLIANVNSSDSE